MLPFKAKWIMEMLIFPIQKSSINFHISHCRVKSVLSIAWQKEKGIDKLILTEWKKLTGTSEINAKYRYVQFCRSLKTYGITLFQVKEKPEGSKRLVPKMLGFTRDAILRMSAECEVNSLRITFLI